MRPSLFTKEELSRHLVELNTKYGMMNETIINDHAPFSRRVVRTHFGSLSKACEELGLAQEIKKAPSRKGLTRKLWTKEEVINVINYCVEKHGYFSKGLIDLNGAEYGKVNHKVVVRIWGSFNAMYEELGVPQKPSTKDTHIRSTEDYEYCIRKYLTEFNVTTWNSVEAEKMYKHLKISGKTIIQRFDCSVEDFAKILGLKYEHAWYTEDYWIQKISKYISEVPARQWTHKEIKGPKGRKLKCDAYFENHNLVLEYNGKQHYIFVHHFHRTVQNFEYQCECDQIKYAKLNELGIKLLVVKFDDEETDVMQRLQDLVGH